MTEFRSSMEEILFEVESGLGITILPLRNKSSSSFSVVYIPFSGSFSQLDMGVAWSVGTGNPAIGWFVDFLDQFKKNNPDKF